jgi:hypothetical protein
MVPLDYHDQCICTCHRDLILNLVEATDQLQQAGGFPDQYCAVLRTTNQYLVAPEAQKKAVIQKTFNPTCALLLSAAAAIDCSSTEEREIQRSLDTLINSAQVIAYAAEKVTLTCESSVQAAQRALDPLQAVADKGRALCKSMHDITEKATVRQTILKRAASAPLRACLGPLEVS